MIVMNLQFIFVRSPESGGLHPEMRPTPPKRNSLFRGYLSPSLRPKPTSRDGSTGASICQGNGIEQFEGAGFGNQVRAINARRRVPLVVRYVTENDNATRPRIR